MFGSRLCFVVEVLVFTRFGGISGGVLWVDGVKRVTAECVCAVDELLRCFECFFVINFPVTWCWPLGMELGCLETYACEIGLRVSVCGRLLYSKGVLQLDHK